MAYWLDYSAARIPGPTIKAAGYTGVIRYIGAGSTGKRTDAAEYRSHLAAGLTVLLVCQGTTKDGDRGFAGGVDMARAALADIKLRAPGYTGPIFFTNDRTTLPNPATWRAYLDGAASVLGRARVGAYGFGNAMDAAKGHATWFWQAGRRADVRAHVHIWQDNNTQVRVGGITCDRNLILKPITATTGGLTMADVDDILNAIGNTQGRIDAVRHYSDAKTSEVLEVVRKAYAVEVENQRRITAGNAAVAALSGLIAKGTNGLDADQVSAAVEAAVAKALKENVVHVDVDVAGA